MNAKLPRHIIVAAFTLATFSAKTQIIFEKKFSGIIEALPQPPDSFQEATEAYGAVALGVMPPVFRSALDELNKTRETILKPLYDKLTVVASGSLANYSPEEQKFLRDAKTLRSAWGNTVMYGFNSWIDYRPGITKQFWTKPKQPLSAKAQAYYQQLLQIEKSLAWQNFLEEARSREGLIFKDEKIDAVEREFSAALSLVPKMKVKFGEGTDATMEMTDPDKAIECINRFDAKKDKVYKQVYNDQLAWWSTNFRRIKDAASKVDEILEATAFGKDLSGNDAQLVPAIADVQGRIVSLLHHLTNIGANIVGISQLAQMSKAMSAESTKSMKAIKENAGM